ncbi:MAG TPA: ribonuclease T2 [Roseiarcus sp.]|nr:ribonuclease T2 [Roseiarcus sp.]
MRARIETLAAAGALLLGLTLTSAAAGAPSAAPGPFDYYVLSLSWSPAFCDLGGAEKFPEQCAAGSGAGFVVHGLWPSNRMSLDPEDCGLDDRASPADLAAARGLYLSEGLARYEYLKHGTCTGLSAADYFATVRYATDKIAIPPTLKAPREWLRLSPRDVEDAFIAANPNLRPENMAVVCGRGELVEVRICVSKDMKAFAACPRVAEHSCRRGAIEVAPVR